MSGQISEVRAATAAKRPDYYIASVKLANTSLPSTASAGGNQEFDANSNRITRNVIRSPASVAAMEKVSPFKPNQGLSIAKLNLRTGDWVLERFLESVEWLMRIIQRNSKTTSGLDPRIKHQAFFLSGGADRECLILLNQALPPANLVQIPRIEVLAYIVNESEFVGMNSPDTNSLEMVGHVAQQDYMYDHIAYAMNYAENEKDIVIYLASQFQPFFICPSNKKKQGDNDYSHIEFYRLWIHGDFPNAKGVLQRITNPDEMDDYFGAVIKSEHSSVTSWPVRQSDFLDSSNRNIENVAKRALAAAHINNDKSKIELRSLSASVGNKGPNIQTPDTRMDSSVMDMKQGQKVAASTAMPAKQSGVADSPDGRVRNAAKRELAVIHNNNDKNKFVSRLLSASVDIKEGSDVLTPGKGVDHVGTNLKQDQKVVASAIPAKQSEVVDSHDNNVEHAAKQAPVAADYTNSDKNKFESRPLSASVGTSVQTSDRGTDCIGMDMKQDQQVAPSMQTGNSKVVDDNFITLDETATLLTNAAVYTNSEKDKDSSQPVTSVPTILKQSPAVTASAKRKVHAGTERGKEKPASATTKVTKKHKRVDDKIDMVIETGAQQANAAAAALVNNNDDDKDKDLSRPITPVFNSTTNDTSSVQAHPAVKTNRSKSSRTSSKKSTVALNQKLSGTIEPPAVDITNQLDNKDTGEKTFTNRVIEDEPKQQTMTNDIVKYSSIVTKKSDQGYVGDDATENSEDLDREQFSAGSQAMVNAKPVFSPREIILMYRMFRHGKMSGKEEKWDTNKYAPEDLKFARRILATVDNKRKKTIKKRQISKSSRKQETPVEKFENDEKSNVVISQSKMHEDSASETQPPIVDMTPKINPENENVSNEVSRNKEQSNDSMASSSCLGKEEMGTAEAGQGIVHENDDNGDEDVKLLASILETGDIIQKSAESPIEVREVNQEGTPEKSIQNGIQNAQKYDDNGDKDVKLAGATIQESVTTSIDKRVAEQAGSQVQNKTPNVESSGDSVKLQASPSKTSNVIHKSAITSTKVHDVKQTDMQEPNVHNEKPSVEKKKRRISLRNAQSSASLPKKRKRNKSSLSEKVVRKSKEKRKSN